MADDVPTLGNLERDLMQLMWSHGPTTAETLRERFPRRLKESTIRTVLRRLEMKGLTKHTVSGRTFVYHPTESRGCIAARAVKSIVDRLCDGSLEELFAGMAAMRMIDALQLRRLANEVSNAKSKPTSASQNV